MTNLLTEELPPEIIDAARRLEMFFQNKGAKEWELMGVRSRNPKYPTGMLDLSDELRWILGRPGFTLRAIAHTLRKQGIYSCLNKHEDEQAVAIHWMLLKYLEHGQKWRDEAEKELRELRELKPA